MGHINKITGEYMRYFIEYADPYILIVDSKKWEVVGQYDERSNCYAHHVAKKALEVLNESCHSTTCSGCGSTIDKHDLFCGYCDKLP